jgi:AcrR family transcriptional regulator
MTRSQKRAPARSTSACGADERRGAVLDAARELLVTHGLVALRLDAVARRAEVDPVAICRWWPSEEALALDVLRQEWVALAAHVYRGACRFGVRDPSSQHQADGVTKP